MEIIVCAINGIDRAELPKGMGILSPDLNASKATDQILSLIKEAKIKELQSILDNSSGGGSWRRNIISRINKIRKQEEVMKPQSKKVSEMQWWEQMDSLEDKIRNGIITSTGLSNAYRVAFAKGQGASRKDKTFNKEKGMHNCCSSKVAWRHRVNCYLLREEF